MSNKIDLKRYLLEKEKPYLLDDNNNGKAIMLSGAWGSGKTHFWQNEIEPDLKEKLKEDDKACVYVSLYGKESLGDIKSDVYLSANGNNLLSKEVATFGMEALSAIKDSDLAIGKAVKAGKALFDGKKMQKGISKLKKGGVICFDDFERKSKDVNLNDLFGFISQLAINLECKVVIILNSDVFVGQEAEIFTKVKEKSINKFFYYKPSVEELFESVFENDKYISLKYYGKDILNTIKETEELNARIYIHVLDNCLEWLDIRKEIDQNIIRVLVLATINFILYHVILEYQRLVLSPRYNRLNLFYTNVVNKYPNLVSKTLNKITIQLGGHAEYEVNYFENSKLYTDMVLIDELRNEVSRLDTDTKQPLYTESTQKAIRNWIDSNTQKLKALWKYGYRLYYVTDVDEDTYTEISKFVKSGILI